MELTSRENAIVRSALKERLESNKKTISYLESLGSNAENDKLFKEYLKDNKMIVDLLDRFWNE